MTLSLERRKQDWLYQNDGNRKCGEGKKCLMIQHVAPPVKQEEDMFWAWMAANGTELLVFIDDVTADRSRRMNSDACRALLSDLHSADGLRAKTCCESIPRVSKGKKNEIFSSGKVSQSIWCHWSAFHLAYLQSVVNLSSKIIGNTQRSLVLRNCKQVLKKKHVRL